MEVQWQDVVKISKVFNSPTRTATLIMLINGRRPHEIAEELGVTIQAISMAIRILHEKGLIERIGLGKGNSYKIPSKTLVFVEKYFKIIGELVNG